MTEHQKDEIQTAVDKLVDGILCQYRPAQNPAPDYEPTTEELARAIGRTIPINLTHLSVALTLRGFKVRRVGTEFRWQMDFADFE